MDYNVDLTEYVTIKGFDPNTIGEQKVEISYVQRDNTYTEVFTVNVSEEVIDDVTNTGENTNTGVDTDTKVDTDIIIDINTKVDTDTKVDSNTQLVTDTKSEVKTNLVSTSDSSNMGLLSVALIGSLVGVTILTYKKKQSA